VRITSQALDNQHVHVSDHGRRSSAFPDSKLLNAPGHSGTLRADFKSRMYRGINRREQRLLGTNLDSEFWWDLGERQVVNLISTWDIIMNHFPGLESITVEFGKVSFVPFSMYAPDLVLGDNVKLLAKSLQELCKLPEFKKIVLRQKQDLKLDWLLEGMVEEQGEWQGVVKLEQA
jgi:hypothetical protein